MLVLLSIVVVQCSVTAGAGGHQKFLVQFILTDQPQQQQQRQQRYNYSNLISSVLLLQLLLVWLSSLFFLPSNDRYKFFFQFCISYSTSVFCSSTADSVPCPNGGNECAILLESTIHFWLVACGMTVIVVVVVVALAVEVVVLELLLLPPLLARRKKQKIYKKFFCHLSIVTAAN